MSPVCQLAMNALWKKLHHNIIAASAFLKDLYFSINIIRCHLIQMCEILREVQTITAVSDVSRLLVTGYLYLYNTRYCCIFSVSFKHRTYSDRVLGCVYPRQRNRLCKINNT